MKKSIKNVKLSNDSKESLESIIANCDNTVSIEDMIKMNEKEVK